MSETIHTTRLTHGRAIEGLESSWDALLDDSVRPTVFSTFDYVQTSMKHLNQGEEVFYLLMREGGAGGKLLAIFPLCVRVRKEHKVPLRVIMHALPPQTTEVDKPSPIILKGHEEPCWQELVRYFLNEYKSWDIMDLEELLAESWFPTHVRSLVPGSKARVRIKPGPDSPIVKLSGEWEGFWSQHRKLRKKCGRLERRIENLRHEITNDPAQIPACLERYIETEKISWKEGEMVAHHRDFYADLLPKLAGKGRVWFSTLYDGDTLVSLEMAYTYLDKVYFSHGTYAPDYAVHSPGMVNSCWFIRHFIGDTFSEGDYLAGFASYVNPWAYRQEHTKQVVIYRVGWKLAAIAVFHLLRTIKRKVNNARAKREKPKAE